MHPIMKCCSIYCSGLCFVGIFFFAILAIMQATKSPFLGENQLENGEPEYKSRVTAICICIGCFLVCGILCCFGLK